MQLTNQPPAVAPEDIMRLDSSMTILGSLAQKYMISLGIMSHSPKNWTLVKSYKKLSATTKGIFCVVEGSNFTDPNAFV